MRMFSVLFAAAFAIATCAAIWAQDPPKKNPEPPAALSAAYTASAPELKAEAGAAWDKAKALEVECLEGKQKGVKVSLRALYDDTYLYMLAQWADATKSDTKSAWIFKDGKWETLKGDEDRMAFAFNIKDAAFAENGCAGACHGYSEKSLHCAKEGDSLDLWHWKAARGGQHGFADDQMIGFKGRGDDKGKSAGKKNENSKDSKLPGWRWADKADRKGVFDETTAVAMDADYKPADGESMPSNLFRTPDGSRADVAAWSEHKDGRWTVLLRRKLVTGNDDDVQFKAGETYVFGLAMFDNTGASEGDEHALSARRELVLEKK